MIVRSGETNPEALRKMGGSVLGHKWSPPGDTFTFLPKVLMGKKGRNGKYNGPQLVPENLGKFQEWQLKYPEVSFESLQHIAGTLNPEDLPTRTSCTAEDVEMDTPWQNGPSFLKLPREEWPVLREFKTQIPEEKSCENYQDSGK